MPFDLRDPSMLEDGNAGCGDVVCSSYHHKRTTRMQRPGVAEPKAKTLNRTSKRSYPKTKRPCS